MWLQTVLSGMNRFNYNFEINTGQEEDLYAKTDFPNVG